jgi:hypothetical protein
MPLHDLQGIGQRIVTWSNRPKDATDAAPYQVFVYKPSKEWDVRSNLNDLAGWLAEPGRAVTSVSISLAEVMWMAIDESGWTTELLSQERDAAGDRVAQAEVHKAVAELLRRPKPFSARVIETITERISGLERSAVFLYRAGALYPSFRTSGLLDDLRSQLVTTPVTLLYPGELKGDFGLSFMEKWEPTYNYRALIVDGT